MAHGKQIGALLFILIYSLQTAATPLTVSRIETDFSKAAVTFGFDGEGFAGKIGQDVSSYVRVEEEGSGIKENSSDNYDVSAAENGVTAEVTTTGNSVLNEVFAAPPKKYANAQSYTTTNLVYYVEDVNSVEFSLDMYASMALTTESELEFAYGYWDEYVGLVYFDGTKVVTIAQDAVFFEKETGAGDDFALSKNNTLGFSYNFSETFTGQLSIQTIAGTFADAQIAETASVPEPGAMGFIAIGLLAVALIGRSLATQARSRS